VSTPAGHSRFMASSAHGASLISTRLPWLAVLARGGVGDGRTRSSCRAPTVPGAAHKPSPQISGQGSLGSRGDRNTAAVMIHPSSRVARPSRDHDLDPCAVLTCTLSDHVVVGGGGGIGGQGTAIGGAGRSIGAIGAPQLMVATLESRAAGGTQSAGGIEDLTLLGIWPGPIPTIHPLAVMAPTAFPARAVGGTGNLSCTGPSESTVLGWSKRHQRRWCRRHAQPHR
jgi:hypothetical protein